MIVNPSLHVHLVVKGISLFTQNLVSVKVIVNPSLHVHLMVKGTSLIQSPCENFQLLYQYTVKALKQGAILHTIVKAIGKLQFVSRLQLLHVCNIN